MKFTNIKLIYNSISFKIVIIILIILIPITSLLIYNNYKSRETLLEQVVSTHKNMLQTYTTQIDVQLKNSMSYSIDMELFQNDPNILASSNDDSTLAFAKYRIFNSLQNILLANNLIDSVFLYVSRGDYFIIASQNGVSTSELDKLKKYIVTNSKEELSTNAYPKSKWTFTQLNKENCLINLSYGKKAIVTGAYTSTDRLLSNYIKKDFADVKLLFIPAIKLGIKNANLPLNTSLISSPSTVADILLTEVLPKSTIFASLPFMQKYYIYISIFFILMIPILALLLQVIVVNPLRKLTNSMLRVHNGDLAHRIKLQHSSNEFEIVNATFNEMMDEVQNLKINVYEEQIKSQKSQLRNLQLQIKPHFLINSLNMVNNLIDNENLTSAKELILHSVEYFRYMTKADDDFVPLNEEIKHVSTYLEIQKIRYKDKFTYSININQLIEDMLIPPMLIQSFIENSIKYAIEMNKLLHISINIEYFEVDYYPHARIIISDTGIGYPVDILERLNLGKKITDSFGDHIGVSNSVQRIKILYNSKASWKFYNNGGAISELTLPALF